MPDLTINLEYFSDSVAVFLDGWSTGYKREIFRHKDNNKLSANIGNMRKNLRGTGNFTK
jgi:hypothetical protein